MVCALFANILENLTSLYRHKYLEMFSKISENHVWEWLYANMQNGIKSSFHIHILLGVDGVRVNHLLSHLTYNVHLPSITTQADPCLNKITKQKTGMQK
jgi:hypothetical protein